VQATSILDRREWVVTLQGIDALENALERCECPTLFVRDGACVCWECGTVYGVVFGYNRPPRRSSWRSAGRAAAAK
jgi:hypothetical protein